MKNLGETGRGEEVHVCVSVLCVHCGELEMAGEHNPGMIHPAIGIGQVATATLAPDPSDRLELAQNESKQARERETDWRRGEGGGGGKMALVGWSAARGFDNSTVMNRRDGAIA